MSHAPCIRHLRDYVAIPSVNPMGRGDLPEEWIGERRYAEQVCHVLRRLGLDAELTGEGPRASVVAQAIASDARDSVLVASHLDTVPVDGMVIDPFDPRVEGGRLYGRGACDTKAGMASLVAALETVLARGTLRRNVVVVGEADEEFGSAGVEDVRVHLERIGVRAPDWVLATEPTNLGIVTHHKGKATARLEARGRACHSSDPAAGRNALVALARAVLALEDLALDLERRPHPLLGAGTLAVAQAGGGVAPNVVPGHAWLVMDRRILPGEDAGSVRRELEELLAEEGIEEVSVAACAVNKHALETDEAQPAVAACRAGLGAAGLEPRTAAVAFGTDAGEFARHGWPGVVMGPGSIEQAHTADEWVAIDQVEAMTRFFVALLEGA